jgi:hypothetical protein
MARAVSSAEAKRLASEALSSGLVDDPLARSRGHLRDPASIQSPAGDRVGWFVPIELDRRLLGFVQLDADGTFRRYASFHGRSASTEGCPPAADWVDSDVITTRARTLMPQGSRVEAAVLTYDGHPDRVAWLVRGVAPDGASCDVMVAGSSAWRRN